ncbi:hypothetical protein CGCF245_v014178 [Colletotrichum fructicola]|nr:hypothetical protein CGCF245_v014178 [Colletotrichum fructicola]
MASTTTAASAPLPHLPYELVLDIAQYVIGDVYAAITENDCTHGGVRWKLGKCQSWTGSSSDYIIYPEFEADLPGRRGTPFRLLRKISQVDVTLRREVLKHFAPFPGAASCSFGSFEDLGLAWIATGDTFLLGRDLSFWWSLLGSLVDMPAFEKQILGTVQEVHLDSLKSIKVLKGEIGDDEVKRFLQLFPNLRRVLIGIPKRRDLISAAYIDDDLSPLTRDSFADPTTIPPFFDIIWTAGVKTNTFYSSDIAIFDTV